MKNNCLLLLSSALIFLTAASYPSYQKQAKDIEKSVNKAEKSNKFVSYLDDAKQISAQSEINLQQIESFDGSLEKSETNALRYNDHLNQIFGNLDLGISNQSLAKKENHRFDQLMIFVSSSMPNKSLSDYAVQAKKVGATLVLRGFINDSFRQTVSFIHSLSEKGTRAVVDPISYRDFAVEFVPQILLIADNDSCKSTHCETTPLHDRIAGNVSLEFALTEIAKNGEFSRIEADRLLKKLRSN